MLLHIVCLVEHFCVTYPQCTQSTVTLHASYTPPHAPHFSFPLFLHVAQSQQQCVALITLSVHVAQIQSQQQDLCGHLAIDH